MSLRVFRKLCGDDRLKSDIDINLLKTKSDDENISDGSEKSLDTSQTANKKSRKKKRQQLTPSVNPFALLNVDEHSLSEKEDEREEMIKGDVEKENKAEIIEKEITDIKNECRGVKIKKKKKTKNRKVIEVIGTKNKPDEDEIDASIREVNEILGELPGHQEVNYSFDVTRGSSKPLLSIEYRHLNPENELKRIFGTKVVQSQGNKKRRNQRRSQIRYTWLVEPKPSWSTLSKTGLSMKLVSTQNGVYNFVFQHSHQYQQAQFQFLDAVASLDPNSIVAVLYKYPYHIDSLIQLSDVSKMSDDMQMAAELIERALYCFQNCFHPLFTLTQGNCRLDFRYAECRSFYIVLFKHLIIVGQKGCSRTALEYCKLILSLDPENDPLCILLMIDFYAIRSQQYEFLIRMYHEWEGQRNLSQLPNFAFSIALARYHLCIKQEQDLSQANQLLQNALIMFPGFLIPLLDKCSVHPDKEVETHMFFGAQSQISQTPSLNLLITLYIGRNYSVWKEPEVLQWLEENTKEVLRRVDNNDSFVTYCKEKRESRYKGTPKNIYRHVVLAEIKDASASLPPDLAHIPVLSYDPIPPNDAIISYARPPRTNAVNADRNVLSSFLQSLLPTYNLENSQDVRALPEHLNEEGAVGEGSTAYELRTSVGTLLEAMRDLLRNLQPPAIPRENDHHEDDQEEL